MSLERERYERMRIQNLFDQYERAYGMSLFTCKHKEDFILAYDKQADHYVYACSCACGFTLNFKPSIFPDGPAYRSRVGEGKSFKLTERGKY